MVELMLRDAVTSDTFRVVGIVVQKLAGKTFKEFMEINFK